MTGRGGAVTGGGGRGRVERRDAIRQPCRRPRGPLPRHVPPLPPAPRQGSPPAAAAVPLTVSPPRLLLLLRLARQRRRRPFSGRLLPQPSLREEGARASDAGTPHGRRRAPPSRPACAQLHLRACVPPLQTPTPPVRAASPPAIGCDGRGGAEPQRRRDQLAGVCVHSGQGKGGGYPVQLPIGCHWPSFGKRGGFGPKGLA